MTTPKLNILLLGPPVVTLDGKPIIIKRRLNRALLFYLAAQSQPVTREAVCGLFWAEEPEVTARKNLREALSRIRTSLGIQELLSEGEQLQLNPAIVRVDYREVDRLFSPLLSSSELNSSGTLPEWMVDQLKTGMGLCRTDRFMQGVSLNGAEGFENWLELNNQSYRYAIAKVIDRMVDHYISSGNLEEALVWLGKAFHVNPFDENWNFLTLNCLRDTGRLQELVSFAGYLEQLYQQHEEAFPPRFSEIKSEAVENQATVSIAASNWPEEERGEPPFIGREGELERLSRMLRTRGIVLLRSEAGNGKTRLLKQFFITQPFSPRLLYCRAHPLSKNVPFLTLVQPLRAQILEEEWQTLNAHDRNLLADFYHQKLQDPIAIPLPEIEGQFLPVLEDVFLAFLNILKIAAHRRPLLFILDDAIWMDLASISLISFLIEQKFFDKHGLLVIAVSPDVENPHLNTVIQRVRRGRKLETIELDPLNHREVEQFIHRVLGRKPDEEMVGNIQHLTGGNPYLLIECLRAMRPGGSADEAGKESGFCVPPETISALVLDKINGLERDSVIVLQAAAALGIEFCMDVIEEMTGIHDEQLVSCIEELLREGFINAKPDSEAEPGYVFKHGVERLVIMNRLGPAGRRNLHLKAARALEKRRNGRPEFSRQLANHYEAAGELQKAARAWLEAGRYGRSQFSVDDTYKAYGRALEMICDSPTGYSEDFIYEVVNEWGNYAHDRDDPRTCERIYQCCLNAGEARHSLLLLGAGLSGLGRAADFLYEYEKAAEYFQRAIFYLSNTEFDSERIKALSRLGIMQFGMDDYLLALSLLKEALALEKGGKDQDSLDNRVNILSYLCFLHIFMGDPLEAARIAEEMARLSILVKRRSARVQAHSLLAMTQYFNGRVQEALQTCRNQHAFAENLQVRFWLSLLELVEGMAYLHNGDLDKSWSLIDQVHRREASYPQEKLFMHAIKIKGDLFRLLGGSEKALGFYQELFDYESENYQTVESRALAGGLKVMNGNLGGGLELISEAIREAKKKELKGIELKARMSGLLLNRKAWDEDDFIIKVTEIQQEITRRGLLDHDYYEGLVAALKLEMAGEKEKALAQYMELQQHLVVTKNVWAEFDVLRRMLSLSTGIGAAGRHTRTRIDGLLVEMASHAVTPAVKGTFQKFRNKWRQYVNDVST